MMVYQETIAPPRVPPGEAENMKLRTAAIANKDELWVKNFIDRLAGVIRDMKP